MKATNLSEPHTRLKHGDRDSAVHLFKVGQSVRLKNGFERPPRAADVYRITDKLPPSGGSPQYRIRSDNERHERMATEDSLEAVL